MNIISTTCHSCIAQSSVLYIIVCPFSFGHCIVCPSSIYGFLLSFLIISELSYQLMGSSKIEILSLVIVEHRYYIT
jgi:hypothetical protein